MYSVVRQSGEKNFTPISMREYRIFPDDKIGVVKQKIALALNGSVSASDIYLYTYQKIAYTSEALFQELGTHRKKYFPFWCNTMKNTNLPNPSNPRIDNKEIKKWKMWGDNSIKVALPIGIKTPSFLQFITDPFLRSDTDGVARSLDNKLTNNELLVEQIAISEEDREDREIFVCLRSDMPEGTLIDNYLGTTASIDEYLPQQNNLIRAFYETSETHSYNLKTHILSMKISFTPLQTLKLPLFKLFQLWQSNATFPLVKFYTLDPMYRLYMKTPPIPLLEKPIINKTLRYYQKEKGTCLFVYTPTYGCKISEDGILTLDLFKNVDKVERNNEEYKKILNHIIMEMNRLLGSANMFPMVEHSSQLIHHDIQCKWQFELNRKIIFNKQEFPACFQTFFIIEKRDKHKDNMQTRYIKVGNFNVFNSQEAFIIQKLRQNTDDVVVIAQELLQNYPLAFKGDAHQIFTQALEKVSEIETRFGRKITKFKSTGPKIRTTKVLEVNPGFPCHWESVNDKLSITISSLDGLYMIPILSRYLSGLLSVLMGTAPTELIKVCSYAPAPHLPPPPPLSSPKPKFFSTAEEESDSESINKFLGLMGKEADPDTESESDSDSDYKGGAGVDPTEWNLGNYFQNQLVKREPNIFIINKNKKHKYNGYARICSSNKKQQPVILTEEELRKLPKENLLGKFNEKGEYDGPDVLQYNTDPNKKYFYMCPRYWCLKTNQPLTQKQVDAGECGGPSAIIQDNEKKKLPPNKTIVERSTEYNYPGFVKSNAPNGACLPCCFKTFKSLIKKKNTCGTVAVLKSKEEGEGEDEEAPETEEQETEETETEKETPHPPNPPPPPPRALPQAKPRYSISNQSINKTGFIVKATNFPLMALQWGYLPFPIQTFFNDFGTSCQISATDTNVKLNHRCLLRVGCEKSENKSFLAWLANLLHLQQNKIIPSVGEITNLLCSIIDDAVFQQAQNANLPLVFTSVKEFHEFLKNPQTLVDYTYLWDIISQPNPKLFPNGINIIIMEIPENDVTNQVEILCPTNPIQKRFFDEKRKSVFVIKRENVYEPIYTYEKKDNNEIEVTKEFGMENAPASLKLFLKKVAKPLFEKCAILPSQPNVYHFDMPILLEELLEKLRVKNYLISKLVENPSRKIIGVIAQYSKTHPRYIGFLPCYPSSAPLPFQEGNATAHRIPPIEHIHMDEVEDYVRDYHETRDFLLKFYSNQKFYKMVDTEEVVIGFLSPSNQMIPIQPPLTLQETLGDGITEIQMDNTWIPDQQSKLATHDTERIHVTEGLKKENQAYNMFRNKMKELNHLHPLVIPEKMKRKFYLQKLKEWTRELKKMGEGHILFDTVNQPHLVQPRDKTKEKLVLPHKNILTHQENEPIYYLKLADELLRYPMVRSFFFGHPNSFYAFGKTEYQIGPNELFILQSQLTSAFFDKLPTLPSIPSKNREYIHGTLFDTLEPKAPPAQKYVNQLNFERLEPEPQSEPEPQLKPPAAAPPMSASSVEQVHVIKEGKNKKKRVDKIKKTRRIKIK